MRTEEQALMCPASGEYRATREDGAVNPVGGHRLEHSMMESRTNHSEADAHRMGLSGRVIDQESRKAGPVGVGYSAVSSILCHCYLGFK